MPGDERDPLASEGTAPYGDFLVTGIGPGLEQIILRVHAKDAQAAKETAERWIRAKGVDGEILTAHDLGSLTDLTQGIDEIEAEGGCPNCEGRGVVSDPDEGPEAEMPCDECDGTGKAKGAV